MRELDELDRKIAAILGKDGRTTNSEIAAQLAVSEGTIRNRIRKLTESDQLRIKGLANPNTDPGNQLVFIAAKIALSKDLRRTARAVADLPFVKAVSIVSGRYDLIIEVLAPPHAMISFISDHLAKVGSITSTESFMVMEGFNKWV
ncbi:MAG: Lrp/AsnC family transcriptional regulator [Lentisphaerae bacterium]|mgnify:CR=1 FL=1|jgi:Lrp/AsnC family transcriptional regulator, regulator for asnA, asnC and gidA|nr:Lrp/AsnC family transcriptional regulator [Lentisphaerota bacterium]MBT4818564.1 Lrp/AsnC family transcriptional regulator [Lentisphaerota bacterium]MBT5610773.1 Lrp/AsnC family transcriptional regulator [Lentisphaerota bacterium]MBT7060855.1 Lrp/AsnC family transcriptional regulator [Lentisphaerota bacterium]MBT7841256.1 Lrp/AsnC family transcriptional regulator [Lentisphaerota bacterium]